MMDPAYTITASTSPTTPGSPTSTVDLVDSEKAIIDHVNEKAAGQGERLAQRVTRLWRGAQPSDPSMEISSKHRKSDGRLKLVQRIDDHPEGYPQLAAYINSDDNFLMARKYGFLRGRVLLYRQDELSVLERDLIKLDEDDAKHRETALRSRKYDEQTDKDPVYSRKVLIQKIDNKLTEYDQVVSKIREYTSLKKPSQRNLASFLNWTRAHKPLTKEESKFEEHQDDLVALYDGQENGWLDGFVEDTMNFCLPNSVMRLIFTSSAQSNRTDDDHIHLYSKRRIDMVVRLVLVLMTVGLLVGPSAVLFLVPGQSSLKICLILVFTLLFAAAMSMCTKAKRHEMLAATATYAAVLVVFLGNVEPIT